MLLLSSYYVLICSHYVLICSYMFSLCSYMFLYVLICPYMFLLCFYYVFLFMHAGSGTIHVGDEQSFPFDVGDEGLKVRSYSGIVIE
jgi:hypothetical protein